MRADIEILGAGRHEPGRLVHSSAYDARYAKDAGWTERATGVRERRFVAAGETASGMAESAARIALERAGLQASDLCAVIGACGVMEQPIPGTSVLVHRRLGLGATGVPAFDVNATCLSFLCALQIVALHIAAGLWSRVLIFSSDVASAALADDDSTTAPLFGDGAAAFVIGKASPASKSKLHAWKHATYSESAESSWLGAGGSRLPARDLDALLAESVFKMDGARAYRTAAAHITPFLASLMDDAGMSLDAINLVAPHQASGHALTLMKQRLGLDDGRVMEILPEAGNQVAASMPSALACAIERGRLHRGDNVLLIGTGAGVSLGGAVLTY